MHGKPSKRLAIALLLTLMLILPLLAMIPGYHENVVAATQPSPVLPNIDKAGYTNPAYNIGPGFPAIVKPGETFTVILKKNLSQGVSIKSVRLLGVILEGSKLKFINETVNATLINEKTINITTPNLPQGLYDIMITLSNGGKLFIARSVWILESLPSNVTFMHVTDLHFGAGWPTATIGQYRRFTGYLLSQLLGVNMILNTGDEADTQASAQYLNSVAFRYTLAYEVPMIINPGNHDYPNGNFEKYYEETLGYRVIDGKILIVIINTDGERGYPDWHNLKTLQEILETHKYIPFKIIMMHHPVFYYQGQVYTWSGANTTLLGDPHKYDNSILSYYWGGNTTAARFFLNLCEEYNVTLVLAGHIHRDQYVEYHSTKTGTITYFQTTTTLAHGSGIYQGFQVDRINLLNDTISYPLAPPWFIGYKNYSRTRVYNSIPLTLPKFTQHWNTQEFDNTYLWGTYHEGKTALIITLTNNLPYLHINKTAVLALPWPDGYKVNLKVLSTTGGANATITDQLRVNELKRSFVAIHFNLPPKSSIELALYSVPDTTPPTAQIKAVIPSTPKVGQQVSVYLTVSDDGWGLKNANIRVEAVKGKLEGVKVSLYTTNTYLIKFKDNANTTDTVKLLVTAEDYAGNKLNTTLNLTVQGPSTGGHGSTTTTTSPQTTSTSSTTTTTSQQLTTSSQSSSSSQSALKSTSSSSPASQGQGKAKTAIVATGIVVVLVLIAAIALAKK